jgi:hypothetical protein
MKIRMSEDYVYDSREDMDLSDEPFLRRRYSCSDRMCGAGDCPRCHPEISEYYDPKMEEEE